MTSVTFKAKRNKKKKCKPSLGSGVKTVWRTLQSSNKNADLNTVSGWSRHQITHQALTCSVTAQKRKNNVTNTILWHHCADFEQANAWVDQSIMTDEARHRTNSHLPAQRYHNNVRKTLHRLFLWRYRADSEPENSRWATKNLLFCKSFGLCAMIKNLDFFKCQ